MLPFLRSNATIQGSAVRASAPAAVREPMSHFPAFFDLKDKAAIVVGATPIALERVRLALAAGAAVRVFAGELSSEGRMLVASPGVAWLPGAPAREDFEHAALAFVATGDCDSDAAAAALAREANVPVNVADRPELSDFIMPAIIRRGDIAIGISTGGAAPALAKFVRESIDRLLPARLGELARFAGKVRQRIRDLFPKTDSRRQVWQELIEGACGQAVLAGRPAEAQRHFVKLLNTHAPDPEKGVVHIVGAGPGDPDLLTLRAFQLLQQADIVFYDELVGAEILGYARRESERVHVGKQKGRHSHEQTDINTELLAAARAGKRVVRLKGGDPFIFGRGGEEAEFLEANGVTAIVVPGITAALGCAATAGIPLTHRDHASSVTFVTGHARDGAPLADWDGLARPDRTIVVYMGLSAAETVSSRLIAAGLSPSTPAAIVARGTRRDQRVSLGTLAGLPALARDHAEGGPALIIVGEVAALANRTLVENSSLEAAA
jgi:uroporphyrin-III C-methyltransferase/precorrin-2 dehydrogenase/sirohydrochlorin ferrochelatase